MDEYDDFDYDYAGHVQMCEECFLNVEDCDCDA